MDNERSSILLEGAQLTSGDRDASYGEPIVNLGCAGDLKRTFRKHLKRPMHPGEEEAIDMVLSKLGRIATGPRVVRDNYVDAATYIAIAGEIAQINEQQAALTAEANSRKFQALKEAFAKAREAADVPVMKHTEIMNGANLQPTMNAVVEEEPELPL